MEILIAKHAGFCFGVKKAIEIAEEVAASNKEKTYVVGQLVHNERVIDELEQKNIAFVDRVDDIPTGSRTVLRAHGEPGTTYLKLADKSITTDSQLTDATCPLVTLVHNVAKKLKNNGYEIILFGKHHHPEAIGTSYHIKGKDTFIVEEPGDARSVADHITKNNFSKVAIISQTTMSVQGYQQLIDNVASLIKKPIEKVHLNLSDLSPSFIFVDTICNPTKQRQSDTEALAQQVDVMIVIGGLNSSNSKELATTSKKYGVETYFIQNADQVQRSWVEGKDKIGVTAGASTPDNTIQDVVDLIQTIKPADQVKEIASS